MLTEVMKAVVLGIVEGITEWLPVSSTGHMLLVDEFMTLDLSEDFKEMFFIVIQFGAILAVILMFWKKMIPFAFSDGIKLKKQTVSLWLKVALACVPGAVVTLLFGDFIEAYLHTPAVPRSQAASAHSPLPEVPLRHAGPSSPQRCRPVLPAERTVRKALSDLRRRAPSPHQTLPGVLRRTPPPGR